MKLNPDCIRDILLTVEDHSDFYHQTEYKHESPFERLQKYTHDEIVYHIMQCEQSGLIYDVHYYDGGYHTDIRDLSPAGHEFLANIRNDSFFNKIKNIAKELGTNSLKDISQIATASASMLIKAHFEID